MGARRVEPPVLPTMQRYLDSLKATEAQQDRHRPSAQHYKPIEHQLEQLMRTLPPVELQRPWPMAEFISRLNGRYRDKPHPMKVSEALRKLGWVRRRDWSNAGAGRRYWYSPV